MPTLAPLPFRAANITAASVGSSGFLSWALLDRRTGKIIGSSNLGGSTETASMIKAWIAADFLRLTVAAGRSPTSSELNDLEIMIRDSDNDATSRLYSAVGTTASITRLISKCHLTDSAASGLGFGYTKLSARDAARMGNCIASGVIAGQKWTPWLLTKMRGVRGEGDFGIRLALPAGMRSAVAIKNGWDEWAEDGTFHNNCLAIGDTWVLVVLQRRPSQGDFSADLAATAKVAKDVATKLLNPEYFEV